MSNIISIFSARKKVRPTSIEPSGERLLKTLATTLADDEESIQTVRTKVRQRIRKAQPPF